MAIMCTIAVVDISRILSISIYMHLRTYYKSHLFLVTLLPINTNILSSIYRTQSLRNGSAGIGNSGAITIGTQTYSHRVVLFILSIFSTVDECYIYNNLMKND